MSKKIDIENMLLIDRSVVTLAVLALRRAGKEEISNELLHAGVLASDALIPEGYRIDWYDTTYRGKSTISDCKCNKEDGLSTRLFSIVKELP